jgi:leucyl aminopeptidase
MQNVLLNSRKRTGVPIDLVSETELPGLLKAMPARAARWVKAQKFKAKAGSHIIVPDQSGAIGNVLFGLGKRKNGEDPFAPAKLVFVLPEGDYAVTNPPERADLLALGWLLESYRFDRYKKQSRNPARLVCPPDVDRESILRAASATKLTRDLINTPTNDMGPVDLEAACKKLARAHKATLKVTRGDALLKNNFPMIHAVGRASDQSPRLVDMHWGVKSHPKVTLVGKGVCFDTGGLNIKPGNSMALMKKDMGGAANVLGLAQMIMEAGLKVRLRVLIPAVENSISAGAFRPSDILPSRKGVSVEIGNTDAEGRLVLADALALGDEEKPDLMIDMATLTGAARVALGPDLPPFYTDDDALAAEIYDAGMAENDPVWRMPFWQPYDNWLSSKVADVNHISSGGFAGSITAALFLKRFVKNAGSYVHFDVFGWAPAAKPGRPHGGEAQAIRALFHVLENRYPSIG